MRSLALVALLVTNAAVAQPTAPQCAQPPAHETACRADTDCALVRLEGSCCNPRYFATVKSDQARVQAWAAGCAPQGYCDMVCPEERSVAACVQGRCRAKALPVKSELGAAPRGKGTVTVGKPVIEPAGLSPDDVRSFLRGQSKAMLERCFEQQVVDGRAGASKLTVEFFVRVDGHLVVPAPSKSDPNWPQLPLCVDQHLRGQVSPVRPTSPTKVNVTLEFAPVP